MLLLLDIDIRWKVRSGIIRLIPLVVNEFPFPSFPFKGINLIIPLYTFYLCYRYERNTIPTL